MKAASIRRCPGSSFGSNFSTESFSPTNTIRSFPAATGPDQAIATSSSVQNLRIESSMWYPL
ncbi:hypothetical protein [Lysobacter gummosus]|uniref:hypothetical protein n=1 Tax=Lysobacter gummosus TaxID=262324 RepID=UPI00362DF4CC